MNIVKFTNSTDMPEYLRNKYAHCINWTYCIPLDTDIDVIKVSQDLNLSQTLDTNVLGGDYVEYKEALEKGWIEESATLKVNSISKYQIQNEIESSELTIKELKIFRTWVAKSILDFNFEFDWTTTHMLNYYKDNMYNKVVQALQEFGTDTSGLVMPINSLSCGCSNGITLTEINKRSYTCDPLMTYRLNIHNKMVEVFSDIDFWMEFGNGFLSSMKKRIDEIVRLNFILSPTEHKSDFIDCVYDLDGNTSQQRNMRRLVKLSQALEYMINDDISGHRLYISDAFKEWAAYLYENMYWV